MSKPQTYDDLMKYEDGEEVKFTAGQYANKKGRVNHVDERLVIEEIGGGTAESVDITPENFTEYFGPSGGRRRARTKRRLQRRKRTVKRLRSRK
jgi:hypothetical protein